MYVRSVTRSSSTIKFSNSTFSKDLAVEHLIVSAFALYPRGRYENFCLYQLVKFFFVFSLLLMILC